MKKQSILLLILVLVLVMGSAFISCDNGSNGSATDANVFLIDISEETDWNYMVLGSDGSSMFIDVNKSTAIPTQLFLKPDKSSDVGATILFKANGLPDKMINNGHIICFENFNGYKYDLALIYPNNTIDYFYDIETDTDWSAFDGRFNPNLSVRARAISFFSIFMPAVTCGLTSILPPPFNAFFVNSCVTSVVKAVVDIAYDGVDEQIGKTIVDVLACNEWGGLSCITALANAAKVFTNIDVNYINQKTQEINQAIIALNNAGYYVVTFSANGGIGTVPAAQTVKAGSSITLPDGSGLSRDGFTFGGWNTNFSGTGTTYSAGASYTPTAPITLYALWNVIGAAFVPVTNISGVPTTGTAGTPLTLSGTVTPSNATNKTIAWSVLSAGTTGATISGRTLNTTAEGIVTVTASIANGAAQGTAYTQVFTITISDAGHDGTPGLAFTPIEAPPRFYSVSAGTVNSGAVVIPSVYKGLPVVSIELMAFHSRKISSIYIPTRVTSIGVSAFAYSTLNSVTMEGVITIGSRAFDDCIYLANINIPSSVKYIDGGAFSGCTSIREITIPSSVQFIEPYAFSGWGPNQTIYIQGHASQASATSRWSRYWLDECDATIIYQGG